ncbi:MAG: tetratricopeptide repeat protein [Bradymonadia bacterium]|jgi:tetratricopeptide (TPR) repeat protein
MRKNSLLFIIILAVLYFVPLHAMAQNNDGKAEVKRSLLEDAQRKAAELEKERKHDVELSSTAEPAARPYQIDDLATDEVNTQLQAVEERNAVLIHEFEGLLSKNPSNPRAAEWQYRVAELEWQSAHYRYLRARREWLAQQEDCKDVCAVEPVADYSKAIEVYRKVLDDYPNYERNDEVLYRLGDALIRANREKEGVAFLHRLTQSYPKAKNLDAAYLALGEFYFAQKSSGTAQAAYQKILDDFENSKFRNYARYKLAWTYLNLADEESYREAISLFKQVIELIDEEYSGPRDQDGQIDENLLSQGVVSFRNQALNDLISTYAEIPDGWLQAKAYMQKKLPYAKQIEKLEQLATILGARAKYEEEIAVYEDLLINEISPKYWRYAQAQVAAYENANMKEKAQTERLRHIAHLMPASSWSVTNADESHDLAQAHAYCARELTRMSAEELLAADALAGTEKTAALSRASRYLSDYLKSFGDSKDAYDAHFYYAYTLDELSDTALSELKRREGKQPARFRESAQTLLPEMRKAAAQYQRVIDLRESRIESQEDHSQAAANRMVFVYANILATDNPSWSLVNSAKAQNFIEEKRDSVVFDAIELTKAEEDFVNAVGQYSSLYPKDDDTPAFLWRSAELYRAKNHYNESAKRFDAIVTNFPQHRYAAVSVGSMFELYNKAKNWDKIAYWAQWLKEKQNFKHYSARELEDAAAYATDMSAAELANSGEFHSASEKLIAMQTNFANREDLYGPAIYKAANYLDQGKAYSDAKRQYEAFLNLPTQTVSSRSDAMLRLAELHVQSGNYDQALQAFQRCAQIGLSSEPNPTPALAVMHGVQLALALGKDDAAAQLLRDYLKVNNAGDWDLYELSGNYVLGERADARALITRVNSLFMLARLLKSDDLETALELLETAHTEDQTIQDRALLLKAEYALEAGDIALCKANLDAIQREKLELPIALAAQERFLRAEVAHRAFDDVQLEFPVRTLRRRIDEKAKARLAAEKLYKEAIQLRSARVSTASALRLAEMALKFRDAFKALPVPKELQSKPEEQEEYLIWLEDELIFPAEDAAAALLEYAHEITLQLGTYNQYSAKSAELLSKIQNKNYPVLKTSYELTE